MKNIMLLFFTMNMLYGFAQNKEINVQKMFLYNLCRDKIILLKEDYKKSARCEVDSFLIKLDTIGECNFFKVFEFYSFEIGKNKITSIKGSSVIFNASYCQKYIIAFNRDTGEEFKIKGFKKNDILFFLKSMKGYFTTNYSYKKILNYLDGISKEIDFRCMYNAMIKMNFNSPCIKPCSDGVLLH